MVRPRGARSVGARLVDAVDPDLVRRAHASAAAVDEVLAVEDVRLRWAGHFLVGQVAVVVDADTPLPLADAVSAHVEEHLRLDLPHVGDVTVGVRAASAPAAGG